MATTEYDEAHRKRLGQLLESRRGEIGYPTRPAMMRGTGLNDRLQSDIENGYRGNFKLDTLGRIATAYRVTRASMLAVLRGETTELTVAPPEPQYVGGAPPWMTEEEKRRLQPWSDEIWERLVKHGENASGGELFGPGTQDAADWDAWKARGVWSLREMVAMAAEVRRRTSSHPNSGTALAAT